MEIPGAQGTLDVEHLSTSTCSKGIDCICSEAKSHRMAY